MILFGNLVYIRTGRVGIRSHIERSCEKIDTIYCIVFEIDGMCIVECGKHR